MFFIQHSFNSFFPLRLQIDTILACGGLAKNLIFIQEHADIIGPSVSPFTPYVSVCLRIRPFFNTFSFSSFYSLFGHLFMYIHVFIFFLMGRFSIAKTNASHIYLLCFLVDHIISFGLLSGYLMFTLFNKLLSLFQMNNVAVR